MLGDRIHSGKIKRKPLSLKGAEDGEHPLETGAVRRERRSDRRRLGLRAARVTCKLPMEMYELAMKRGGSRKVKKKFKIRYALADAGRGGLQWENIKGKFFKLRSAILQRKKIYLYLEVNFGILILTATRHQNIFKHP